MSDWKAAANVFGRGTAAGDAIYRCYARPVKESTLDPVLLEHFKKLRRQREEEEAQMYCPKPIPKSKAMINRPRPCAGPRLTAEEIARRRLAAIPRKKPESVIQRELSSFAPLPMRKFNRPPLNDNEKERLGQIFQFGEVPGKPKEFTGVIRSRYAALDKRYGLKEKFEALAKKVLELREELNKMQEERLSASPHHDVETTKGRGRGAFNLLRRNPLKVAGLQLREQDIQNEISNCLTEMKTLDAEIRRLNIRESKDHGVEIGGDSVEAIP
ncbi:uncharacterized protein TEOVI_000575600 [Trypanosoma equiperdum]|uniref:Enkurin domain-containing protein n=1 Tax=Trypanosoma equiperdum TaxID=5694 RepID=A0A1G4I4C2_TRYEQ|nr:hypothetical protein, conserved [Trypanosoma equiperdum]